MVDTCGCSSPEWQSVGCVPVCSWSSTRRDTPGASVTWGLVRDGASNWRCVVRSAYSALLFVGSPRSDRGCCAGRAGVGVEPDRSDVRVVLPGEVVECLMALTVVARTLVERVPADPDALLTAEQVGELLQLSLRTLNGVLPHHPVRQALPVLPERHQRDPAACRTRREAATGAPEHRVSVVGVAPDAASWQLLAAVLAAGVGRDEGRPVGCC